MPDVPVPEAAEQVATEVIRYDSAPTRSIIRQDNGFLRVKATVGRTGVLEYQQPDGSVRRELRSPDHVFDATSLESLALIPVTLDHPTRTSPDFGLVRADNIKRLAVGHGGDSPVRVDDKLDLNILITDPNAIGAVEQGVRQISPGYTTRLDHTPGVWQGQPYDAVQTEIRYNHVAIVERGRAGPSVRLHLDSDAAEVAPLTLEKETPIMVKLNLDGVDFECSEQLKQAIEASAVKQQAELETTKGQVAALTARADAAEAERDELKTKCVELQNPERLQEAVAGRLSLEREAGKILGETKLDGLSEAEVKTQVVAKVFPAMAEKLVDCDPAYLQASFDLAVQSHSDKPTESLGQVRADAEKAEVKLDAAAVRAKYIQEQKDAWKQPLTLKGSN